VRGEGAVLATAMQLTLLSGVKNLGKPAAMNPSGEHRDSPLTLGPSVFAAGALEPKPDPEEAVAADAGVELSEAGGTDTDNVLHGPPKPYCGPEWKEFMMEKASHFPTAAELAESQRLARLRRWQTPQERR
jgi:hypothetical protein